MLTHAIQKLSQTEWSLRLQKNSFLSLYSDFCQLSLLSFPSGFLLSFTETLGRTCAGGRFLHVLFQYRLDIKNCCSFS